MASIPERRPSFRAGDVVEGRYRIVEPIAEGGMGTVFLATHLLIKRRVALKLLHPELAQDHNMVLRFLDEARAVGSLGHPNIVECTDMGFTRSQIPYIVFEYLEGSLLSAEIDRVKGLGVPRTLRIARKVASALDAAHGAGIVHLDLKSDNVFLSHAGGALDHVKVLDFGISRFLEGDRRSTQRAVLAGTPDCMAPEQIVAPETVDERADIYALGVLIYEMLTAKRPFDAADQRVLLHRIVHEPPPPLAHPSELAHVVVERMLAKDRERRFSTMKEVDAVLDEIERHRASAHRTLEWGPKVLIKPRRKMQLAAVPPSIEIPVDDLTPRSADPDDTLVDPPRPLVDDPAPAREAPPMTPPVEARVAREDDAPPPLTASDVPVVIRLSTRSEPEELDHEPPADPDVPDEVVDRWIAQHRRPSLGWLVGAMLAGSLAGGVWLVQAHVDVDAALVYTGLDIDVSEVLAALPLAMRASLGLAGFLIVVYLAVWLARR